VEVQWGQGHVLKIRNFFEPFIISVAAKNPSQFRSEKFRAWHTLGCKIDARDRVITSRQKAFDGGEVEHFETRDHRCDGIVLYDRQGNVVFMDYLRQGVNATHTEIVSVQNDDRPRE